jgi:hypothetical protein
MIERPRRRDDLLVRDVEEELLIYDLRNGDTSLLNGTAAAIFDMCDGQTPVSVMAEEILSVLLADPETVRDDVRRIIGEMVEKGILEDV